MSYTVSILKKYKDQFSPKLKRVATYIIEHPEQIISKTISELAEAADCSEAAISRLCKEINFKGFQDLKITLAGELSKDYTEKINGEIEEGDSPKEILNKVFVAHIKGFTDTLNIINEKELEEAVEFLASAKHIEFFGSGGSGVVAMDACHKFLRSGVEYCGYQTDTHFMSTLLATLNPETSVIVAISHSGSNKSLIDVIKIGKERGVKILALTSYNKSPLTKISDFVLHTPTHEINFRSESASSRLVQLALIDTLSAAVALKNKEKSKDNMKNIRKAISYQRM